MKRLEAAFSMQDVNRANLVNQFKEKDKFPQGLKPLTLGPFLGAAEAVP